MDVDRSIHHKLRKAAGLSKGTYGRWRQALREEIQRVPCCGAVTLSASDLRRAESHGIERLAHRSKNLGIIELATLCARLLRSSNGDTRVSRATVIRTATVIECARALRTVAHADEPFEHGAERGAMKARGKDVDAVVDQSVDRSGLTNCATISQVRLTAFAHANHMPRTWHYELEREISEG